MWFASGNRDGQVFADPYRFDVTRTPNDHVAFGRGSPHFCLGNNLAWLEVRRVRSNFVNGIKTLPVRISPPQ